MNFDITNTDWQQVENLTDDTTYFLQSKTVSNGYGVTAYGDINILFAQEATTPDDNKTGILTNAIKFKKVSGLNIYVKCITTPTNFEIQEVQ